MNIAEIAGLISQLLFIAAFIWYVIRIAKGGVRVSVSTFTVLAITSLSQAIALYIEQEWYPAVFMSLTTLVNVAAVSFAFRTKNYQFKLFDKIVLGAALLGIVAWYVTNSAAWNVYILSAAVFVSFFPLIIKTFKDPASEARGPWVLTFFASSIFLLTITSTDPINWIVQARQMFLATSMTIAVLFISRTK